MPTVTDAPLLAIAAGPAWRSEAKRAERHAAKAARTALYASQAKSNKKQKSSSDGTAKSFSSHAISNCGNPGCKRCYPQLIPALAFHA